MAGGAEGGADRTTTEQETEKWGGRLDGRLGDVRVEATRAFLLLCRGIFHKWIVTSIRDVVSVGRKKDPVADEARTPAGGSAGGHGGRGTGRGRSINAKWPWKRKKKCIMKILELIIAVKVGQEILHERHSGLVSSNA